MARAAGDGSKRGGCFARRFSRVASAVAVAAALLAGAHFAMALDELQFFRIGTASTTGTYFQIGGVIASAISRAPGTRDCAHGGSCGVAGLVAVAQATQGSVQNVIAVNNGQLEAALAQSDITSWSYAGAVATPHRCGPGKEEPPGRNAGAANAKARTPLRNLRAVASLYPEDVHVVVRADSAIRNLRDLKGKRVALGEPESGTLADARVVLDAAGLNECEMKAEYLRLPEAADGVAQGQIDAFFMVSGYPVPAITDVAATVPTRLVPIPPDVIERLVRKYTFIGADTIPGGSYPNIDDPTATISTKALLIVREDVDTDLVYAITKALWSDATKRLLEAAHPVGKRIRLTSAFDGVAIPFHPGAVRYYREIGMTPPDTQ